MERILNPQVDTYDGCRINAQPTEHHGMWYWVYKRRMHFRLFEDGKGTEYRAEIWQSPDSDDMRAELWERNAGQGKGKLLWSNDYPDGAPYGAKPWEDLHEREDAIIARCEVATLGS